MMISEKINLLVGVQADAALRGLVRIRLVLLLKDQRGLAIVHVGAHGAVALVAEHVV